MACSCNSNSSSNNVVKVYRFFIGDTLDILIYNGVIPDDLNLSATSIVNAQIKNQDLNTISNVVIADLADGNNFAAKIVHLLNNAAYVAGNYKLYLKVVTGTLVETVDLNIYFTYSAI